MEKQRNIIIYGCHVERGEDMRERKRVREKDISKKREGHRERDI